MNTGRSDDSVRELQERYSNYKVYDEHYEEIGKVDDIFVDENDQPEYIGVKMGFLGLKSTVVPMELVRINDKRGLIEVAGSKEFIKDGPSFEDDQEISPEHEAEVLRYYGLDRVSQKRESSYGAYGGYPTHDSSVDMEYGERSEPSGGPAIRDERSRKSLGESREEPRREEPLDPVEETGSRPAARRGRDEVEAEGEVRVQRKEEELRAGVRQRESGSVNVRKRVRTDQEQLRVPKRREEVTVERVPVEESGASTAGSATPGVESTEDEVRIPIVEEEVVVEKKPVVKEEIRIRKDTVKEEEVVQAEVRKEEVEVEDETRRRDR